MSVVFVPKRQRGKAQINQETIQRVSKLNIWTPCLIRSRTVTHLGYLREKRPLSINDLSRHIFSRLKEVTEPYWITSYVIYAGLVCVVFLVTYGDADMSQMSHKVSVFLSSELLSPVVVRCARSRRFKNTFVKIFKRWIRATSVYCSVNSRVARCQFNICQNNYFSDQFKQ